MSPQASHRRMTGNLGATGVHGTEASARAYLRDLPEAELHLLDGGHWLLETHLDEVIPLMRDFLTRVHAQH